MNDSTSVTVSDIELFAESLDFARAAAIFREHGALVVRGLSSPYVADIVRDIEQTAAESLALLDQATQNVNGWTTPNGTLFIPAPTGYGRDRQIMVLAVGYKTSAAFFRSAFDEKAVGLVEAILGPNVELFMDGQCLYKEPVGGHAKELHQDSAYFEHRYEGPVAALNYAVDTDLVNGALYVVPGSHRLGTLPHIDTASHLGLDPAEWTWERALPITGRAGDAIFFHYRTIHGSQTNRSTRPRPVFINRYRRVDDYVTVSATNADGRAAAEKRAEEARKGEQQGFMVRGARRHTFAGGK